MTLLIDIIAALLTPFILGLMIVICGALVFLGFMTGALILKKLYEAVFE